jgi:hypothetical protein
MQRIAKSGMPFLLSQKPRHFLQQLMCDVSVFEILKRAINKLLSAS